MTWEESGIVDEHLDGRYVTTKLRLLPDMTFTLHNAQSTA